MPQTRAWRELELDDLRVLAARVVDLQRRVIEREALAQHRLHRAARRVAVAVGADEHVRRERREAAGDLPHVQVVDLDDALLGDERAADRLRVEALRRRLQEDRAPRPRTSETPERAISAAISSDDDRVRALEAA